QGALLHQSHRLEAERREGRVGPTEPRSEHDLGRPGEPVVERQTGDQAEGQRARDVDDERPPGEHAPGVAGDGPVEEIAGDGPAGAGGDEGDPGGRAHDGDRPTYLTTSTSSRMTRPSVISASS